MNNFVDEERKQSDHFKAENEAFFDKAEKAFIELFELAKSKNELHFALSLNPEFRGIQDAGWSTAIETFNAFDCYMEIIENLKYKDHKARVAMAFYCHLSEASGYYEIPKNMLRVSEGNYYILWPFKDLVQKHRDTGKIIAPNANKVLKDLAGHAQVNGLHNLAEIFRDAFDSDLRNSYAHADYIIWQDGIRLRKRNGGYPRIIKWVEFDFLFNRAINFFHILRSIVYEYLLSYNPAKTIIGKIANEPEGKWLIEYDPVKKTFRISSLGWVVKEIL
jgi:hypothetical protein